MLLSETFFGAGMSFIKVGEKVRIYYEDDAFDEGEVTLVRDGLVIVDFYDWVEQWREDQFALQELYMEGVEVLVPKSDGVMLSDFRERPGVV